MHSLKVKQSREFQINLLISLSTKMKNEINVVGIKRSIKPAKFQILFYCGSVSYVKEMNNAFVMILNEIIRCNFSRNSPHQERPVGEYSVLNSYLILPKFATFQGSSRVQMKFLVFGDQIHIRNHTDEPLETASHQI